MDASGFVYCLLFIRRLFIRYIRPMCVFRSISHELLSIPGILKIHAVDELISDLIKSVFFAKCAKASEK